MLGWEILRKGEDEFMQIIVLHIVEADVILIEVASEECEKP